MAVNVGAVSGWDIDYPRRQAGPRDERSPLSYYADAAAQGEAAGRWFGKGLVPLGLAGGQMVDLDEDGVYTSVYRQVNPLTGERMGRRPMSSAGRQAQVINDYREANPHATRADLRKQELTAAHKVRESHPYTDDTAAWSKSISLLGASLLVNQFRAQRAGDTVAADYWAGRFRAFQDVLQEANRAGLEYIERNAGYVRTGYHGAKVDGQETGKWEKAGLVVTSWLQGTNREGEPHWHCHNLLARMALTERDGKWRALDTMRLRAYLRGQRGVVAAHTEAGLSREFGVEWVARADGAGYEIRGVTQEQIDLVSSRAQDVDADTRKLAEKFELEYGRPPNQRELKSLHEEAWRKGRPEKAEDTIDWTALAEEWDSDFGSELAAIAPAVMGEPSLGDLAPAQDDLARAARRALARVSAEQATWTRADYLKHLQAAMPPARLAPGEAVSLLESVADRAIAGEFEPVMPMAAPEWPPLPPELIRDTDGMSVFTPPGSERFATRVQLTMEEELIAAARQRGAEHLSRDAAARHLGADADTLDAALLACARDAREDATTAGLRLDQASAVWRALTSPETVTVMVGPAGSGKTHALAGAAKAWEQEGGQVIGLATSQAARNALADAGVSFAQNTSVFLGHTKEQRGKLGITELAPGTLILADEASMMSTADLRDIVRHAAHHGHKVIVAGDPAQLTAVESGGGLGLVADDLGYVQLAEAVRFKAEWERDASLRLRASDVTALAEYADQGRVFGGTPEEMQARARQLYVAEYLQGRDVRVITASRELGREMARHIRSDLEHLGLVGDGPQVPIAGGQATAGKGDIIRATENQYRQGVTNHDTFLIDEVNDDRSLTVRRSAGRDPETGQRRWSDRTFRWAGYADAESGLWLTGHAVQGSTVTTGILLATGAEDAQWLYPAWTRGTDANYACVYTSRPAADPAAGSRPAPELARDARVQAERAGEEPPEASTEGLQPARPAEAVLADIMARDGQQRSAMKTRQQNLVNNDHLARKGAIWDALTRDLRIAGYREAVAGLLPGERRGDLDTSQATWLWRSMRAAEAAGLDAREVAARAVQARSLDDAENAAAVIDTRIRKQVGPMVPRQWRPWSDRVPDTPDPRMREYLTELARTMDARKERLGEHAAEASPEWAVRALGPVPEAPLERLDWQGRAAHLAAYREQYGWEHPRDPIGTEPTGDAPEKRAAWHAAQAAITRTDQADLSAEPDSRLWMIRDQYEAETSQLPEYPADRLRAVRTALTDARASAVISHGHAEIARRRGDHEAAERHQQAAGEQRVKSGYYRERADLDARKVEDYEAAERVVKPGMNLAVLADTELRARNPDMDLPPLRTAEPEPPEGKAPEVPSPEDRAAAREQAGRQHETAAARLEERQGVKIPAEDHEWQDEGDAWPQAWPMRDPDAILQPPPPEIRPAREVQQEPEMERG